MEGSLPLYSALLINASFHELKERLLQECSPPSSLQLSRMRWLPANASHRFREMKAVFREGSL
jgi:hypothetical protein